MTWLFCCLSPESVSLAFIMVHTIPFVPPFFLNLKHRHFLVLGRIRYSFKRYCMLNAYTSLKNLNITPNCLYFLKGRCVQRRGRQAGKEPLNGTSQGLSGLKWQCWGDKENDPSLRVSITSALWETTKLPVCICKRKIHVSYGLYLLIFTGYKRVLQAVECLINIILFANGSAIGEWYFLLNVQARFNKSVVCSFTFHCVGWDVSRAPSAGAGKQFRDAEINESAGCVNSFCLCWLPLCCRKVPNTKGLHHVQ